MGADDSRRVQAFDRSAPPRASPARQLAVTVGKACDVGLKRDSNEDTVRAVLFDAARPKAGAMRALLLVADGMGGHSYGELASRIAAEAIADDLTPDTAVPVDASTAGRIEGAVHKANQAIRAATLGLGSASKTGTMGTTVTVAVIADNNKLTVGHVGDTRAYLARGEQLTQLTSDHTQWVGRQVYLTRSLGESDSVSVDVVNAGALEDGDAVILCSDGLTNHVDEETILGCLHSTASPQEAADAMVDLANDDGGTDNISVIVAEIGRFRRRRSLALDGSGRGSRGASVARRRTVAIVGISGALAILVPAVIFLPRLLREYSPPPSPPPVVRPQPAPPTLPPQQGSAPQRSPAANLPEPGTSARSAEPRATKPVSPTPREPALPPQPPTAPPSVTAAPAAPTPPAPPSEESLPPISSVRGPGSRPHDVSSERREPKRNFDPLPETSTAPGRRGPAP